MSMCMLGVGQRIEFLFFFFVAIHYYHCYLCPTEEKIIWRGKIMFSAAFLFVCCCCLTILDKKVVVFNRKEIRYYYCSLIFYH